ncbi:MAG: hypothetical protein ACXQS4_00960 [Methermicoccaceae archaeon]
MMVSFKKAASRTFERGSSEIPTTEPERAIRTFLEGVGVEHLPPSRMREGGV